MVVIVVGVTIDVEGVSCVVVVVVDLAVVVGMPVDVIVVFCLIVVGVIVVCVVVDVVVFLVVCAGLIVVATVVGIIVDCTNGAKTNKSCMFKAQKASICYLKHQTH